jgi:hypothetical protein
MERLDLPSPSSDNSGGGREVRPGIGITAIGGGESYLGGWSGKLSSHFSLASSTGTFAAVPAEARGAGHREMKET